MNGVVAPQRWQIWIGKHNSPQWHVGGYLRHAVTLGTINPSTGVPEPHDNTLIKNTQAITFGLGSLIIFALYTRVPYLGEYKFTGHIGDAMRQLSPFRGPIGWPGEAILTDVEVGRLATAFDRVVAKFKWKDTQ